MKNIFKILIAALVLSVGCAHGPIKTKPVELVTPKVTNAAESMAMLLEKAGSYVNSEASPFLIGNDVVLAKGKSFLLLDIRSKEDYVKGHVNGAINIDRKDILDMIKKDGVSQYDKVIIIDNTGLEAAYVSSVLRAAGVGNAYAMREGMASWSSEFASAWTGNLSNKYANSIETESHGQAPKGKLPQLKVKATTATGILEERAKAVVSDNALVTAEEVMNNPKDYYIINYWPKAKYEEGHLPGAVAYTPKKSMGLNQELKTIPADKKIAVYCFTGQTASAVVGYLRVLGYDAYSIAFGTNGFMYERGKTYEYHPYIAEEKVRNFPLVKGEKPTEAVVTAAASTEAPVAAAPAAAPAPAKKKKAEGGGGCG